MPRRSPRVALALLLISAAPVGAAEVLYSFLDPEGDNVFDVFASVTGDDTLGLATYNVQLTGFDDYGIDAKGVSFTPNDLSGLRADDFAVAGFNNFLTSPVGTDQHSSTGSQFGVSDPIWGVGMAPVSFETFGDGEFNLDATAFLGQLDLGTDEAFTLDDLHSLMQPSAALFGASGSTYDVFEPESFVTFGAPEGRRPSAWRIDPGPVESEPLDPEKILHLPPGVVEGTIGVAPPIVVVPPVETAPLEPTPTPEVIRPGFVEPEPTPIGTVELTPPAPEPILEVPVQITPAPIEPIVVEPTPLPIETVEIIPTPVEPVEITPVAPEALTPEPTPTEPTPAETAPPEQETLAGKTDPVVDPTYEGVATIVSNPDFLVIDWDLAINQACYGCVLARPYSPPTLSPILLEPTDLDLDAVAIDWTFIDLFDYDRLVFDGAAMPIAFADGAVLNRSIAIGESFTLVPEPGTAALLTFSMAGASLRRRPSRSP